MSASSDVQDSSPPIAGVIPDGGGQYRRWVFTCNHPDDAWRNDGVAFWNKLSSVVGNLGGGVYQVESGKAGTVHLQGCFHTDNKLRFITMKNKFRSASLRGWIAPSVDFPAAVKYCTKEDTRVAGPFFHGDVSATSCTTQGTRTDIAGAAADALAGKSIKEIAIAHPTTYIKYHGGIAALVNAASTAPVRDFKTIVHWYYGVAGTGKTRKMTEECKKLGSVYALSLSKDSHVQWWSGYEGQTSVTLDDYNGELKLTEWFKLADRYEYKVRVDQNSWVQFTSKHIFVTCNGHPDLIYAKEFMKNKNWKEAFKRRIDDLVEFKEEEAVAPLLSPASMDGPMREYHDTVCRSNYSCDCYREWCVRNPDF